jgi:hypothetical protein
LDYNQEPDMTKHKETEKPEEVVEHVPTPDEAKQMFAENPGLDYVVTTEGGLHRDGRKA